MELSGDVPDSDNLPFLRPLDKRLDIDDLDAI